MEPTSLEPASLHELDLDRPGDEELRVQAWRAEQLSRLGLPRSVADAFADLVDWRELADLLERGCPLGLALEIAR